METLSQPRNETPVYRTFSIILTCLFAAALVSWMPSWIRYPVNFIGLTISGFVLVRLRFWNWRRAQTFVLIIFMVIGWGILGCGQMQDRERNTLIAYSIQNLEAAQRHVELQTKRMASHEDVVSYLEYAHNDLLALKKREYISESTYAGFYSAIQRLKSEPDPGAMAAGINELHENVKKLMNRNNRITWKGGGSTS